MEKAGSGTGSTAAGGGMAYSDVLVIVRNVNQNVRNRAVHNLTELVQCLDADIFTRSKALDHVWVDAVVDQPVCGYAMIPDVSPEWFIAYHLMHLHNGAYTRWLKVYECHSIYK